MTTRLQVAKLCLGSAVLKYKQHRTMPTTGDARALLAELGVNGAERVAKPRMIETQEQLKALPRDSVIRDHEGRVLELLSGWLLTGEHDTFSAEDIVLPALVLWTPEDES